MFYIINIILYSIPIPFYFEFFFYHSSFLMNIFLRSIPMHASRYSRSHTQSFAGGIQTICRSKFGTLLGSSFRREQKLVS